MPQRGQQSTIYCEVLHHARLDLLQAFCEDNNYLDIRLRTDLAVYDRKVVFDPVAWNHAFVPPERVQVFKEACDACGLLLV